MIHGWRYRLVAAAGTAGITLLAVLAANHPLAQAAVTTYVPLFWRLDPIVMSGGQLQLAAIVSVAVMLASLIPLFKPRPRRILDTVALAQERVVIAGLVLATLGYFNWTYRLPRATLLLLVGLLCVALPAWFVAIRRPSAGDDQRALIVGDDAAQMAEIHESLSMPLIGYICPPSTDRHALGGARVGVAGGAGGDAGAGDPVPAPDGGGTLAGGGALAELDRLGGLSQLEAVLVEHDVDTVVIAFEAADRGEFFGTLDICHAHGVDAKVHRAYADDVLTAAEQVGSIVDVDVEPWDPQDYAFKRLFDVAFSYVGLVCLAPLMALIAIAIKLDSPGPVLYEQDRTAAFGETFSVYKFRTMVTDAEAETGAKISDEDAGDVDPRVTRVGRVLRKTHMDEIPQLWAIFTGKMSVVGPRPERPEIDTTIQTDGIDWSKRWFIKPGLTGLAQINEVTGHEPEQKLRYDIQYVRNQSLSYDVMIVARQIWMVVTDAVAVAMGRDPEAASAEQSDAGAGRADD